MMHIFTVIVEFLFFGYISFLSGTLVLEFCRLKPSENGQSFPTAVLLGYGAFALVSLSLGLLHVFDAPWLWCYVAIVIVLSRQDIQIHFKKIPHLPKTLKKGIREAWQKNGKITTTLYAGVLLFVMANATLTLVPITAHDTLFYHLPIMKTMAHEGAITFNHDAEHYSYHLILGEILYTTPLVLFGETHSPFVFGLVQFSVLPLFLIQLFMFLKRKVRYSFLVPTSLILVLGIMNLEREILHFGYIDVLVYAFGFGGLFLIFEDMYANRLRLGTALSAGLLFGFAISVKFLGLYFLLFASLFILWQLLRERVSIKRAAKLVSLFALGCILVGSFWYIKNLKNFGNPVYPMYSYPGFNEGIGLFMLDRTPENMIIFPFYRWGVQWFQHPEKESSSDLVIFAYLVVMYATLIVGIFVRAKKWRPIEIVLFVFVQGYLWFLFYSSHQARFLVPAIMILPAFVVLVLDSLFTIYIEKSGSLSKRQLLRIAGGTALLTFIVLFGGNIHYFKVRFDYIRGALSESEYILKVGSQ